MSKMLKKIFFVVWSIAILFAISAVVASAETIRIDGLECEVHTEGEYEYVILVTDDIEYAIITKYEGTRANITIPSKLGGYNVSIIYQDAFKDNTAIQSVTIGETVVVVYDSAFKGCTGLQTVLIAKNVGFIGNEAFYNCTGLKSVTFQKGTQLQAIGNGAFRNCTSLNNFTIPESVTEIGEWAFCECDSLSTISIPDSVISLGGGAFFQCNSIAEVTIGNGVPELLSGYNWGACGAFENCISLKNVTLGDAVKTIGYDCFYGTALENIIIPDNVEIILENAFRDCHSLVSVDIGDGVITVESSVFRNCTALKDINIGSGVSSIGEWTFSDCDALEYIYIPTNVISLGGAMFYGCDNLTNAIIGNGVVELAPVYDWDNYGTFENCIKLKEITLGSAIKTIGNDCFKATVLEKVIIPDNVVAISTGAFMDCTSLVSVEIGNGVTTISDNVFRNCKSLVDVSVGRGVISIGKWTFADCDALEYIYIPSNVTNLDGALFYSCDNLKKAVIGNGVVSLVSGYDWGGGYGIFEECVQLEDVTLGNGIISIGTDTFAGTKIKTLTIPSKVSTLENGAFAGATELTDVYFTGNWPASVGEKLFENTSFGLTIYYINGKTGYTELDENKALYTPVTVAFDNNNDDVFAAPTDSQVLAPVGGYVIEPIKPTAYDYLFDGWYKDAECTEKWDFENDTVTSNITLYAKWNSVDEVAPVRPENLTTVEKDGNSITLQWSEVAGATGYNIYVDGEKVNDSAVSDTVYKCEILAPATTYEFVVTAVNSIGESKNSIIFADRTTDHIHSFGEWETTKEADCSNDGEQTRICDSCGAKESEIIPATVEHIYGDWYVSVEPTCLEEGEQTRMCSVCDKTETEILDVTQNHIYGEWFVVTEATQENEGLKKRVCEICGDSETTTIPKIPAILMGDVNGDGKINAADARMALRAASRLEIFSEEVAFVADVTGDGKVNAADARKILRMAAHLE